MKKRSKIRERILRGRILRWKENERKERREDGEREGEKEKQGKKKGKGRTIERGSKMRR
jgi:hypothetical protein